MILMIIGGLLALFGLADFIGSFAGYDLWTTYIGVELPEIVWQFSAYAELALGVFLFKLGLANFGSSGSSASENLPSQASPSED